MLQRSQIVRRAHQLTQSTVTMQIRQSQLAVYRQYQVNQPFRGFSTNNKVSDSIGF